MIGGSPRIGGTSGRGIGIHPHPDSDGFSAGDGLPLREAPLWGSRWDVCPIGRGHFVVLFSM